MNPASGADALSGALVPFVPGHARRGRGAAPAGRVSSFDPLDHADPHTAADVSAVENLLRCWVRETNTVPPEGDVLWLPLAASGLALLVPVTYWSATGWYRFGRPALVGGPTDAPAVDAPPWPRCSAGRPPTAPPAAPLRRVAARRSPAPVLRSELRPARPRAARRRGPRAHRARLRRRIPGTVPAKPTVPAAGRHRVTRWPRGRRRSTRSRAPRAACTAATARPPAPYDTTGALDSAYGTLDGVADATAALADAFSAEHEAGYGPEEGTDGAAYGAPEGATGGGSELVGRVADSVRRTAAFIAGRRAAPGDPCMSGAFLSGEQSLLFGHPLHTPRPRAARGSPRRRPGRTRPSCAVRFRCTGWPYVPPYSPPTWPGPSAAAPYPPSGSSPWSPARCRRCPTAWSPCRCTPGRRTRSGTAARCGR